MKPVNYTMYLRPESAPLTWRALDAAQKRAAGKVLGFLDSAVGKLEAPTQRSTDPTRSRLGYALQQETSLGLAFISGERGTGKTTLLLSLMQAWVDPSAWKGSDQGDRLERLLNRVLWLTPLDMEPLPRPTNLLAAILARVEEEVGRLEPLPVHTRARAGAAYQHVPGILDPWTEEDAPLVELRRLQADVALAWEGNLIGRASHLDPEPFAQEVMRAERARLSLDHRLTGVLDSLAERLSATARLDVRNPLFLLPVDDVDLNPTRCLELLRFIRMIRSPRLFVLAFGNQRVTETVFRLQLAGEFAQLAAGSYGGSMPTVWLRDAETAVASTSAHAMRKLIPPSHRIELERMTVQEALCYGSDVGPHLTIADLLAKCPIGLDWAARAPSDPDVVVAGQQIANLHDMIAIKPVRSLPRAEESSRVFAYSGADFLSLPPRHVVDLWFAVSKNWLPDGSNPRITEVPRERVIDSLAKWLRFSLAEEETLLPEERERLRERLVVFDRLAETWVLDTEIVKGLMTSSGGPTFFMQTHAMEFGFLRGWSFEPNVPAPSGASSKDAGKSTVEYKIRTGRELTPSTGATLELLHDLLVSSTPRSVIGGPLTPPEEDRGWARAVWASRADQNKITVNWRLPRWQTFFQLDLFASAWNEAVSQSLTSPLPLARRTELLAYTWLSTATSILSADPPPRTTGNSLGEENWHRLSSLLATLWNEWDTRKDLPIARDVLLRSLFSATVLTLAPEAGLPETAAQPLLSSMARLNENSTLLEMIKDTRLELLRHFAGKGAVLLGLRLIAPEATSAWLQAQIEQIKGSIDSEIEISRDVRALLAEMIELQVELTTIPPKNWSQQQLAHLAGVLRNLASIASSGFLGRDVSAAVSLATQLEELATELPAFQVSLGHPMNQLGQGALCPRKEDVLAALATRST